MNKRYLINQATVYGSDAIAGVVNIITVKNFEALRHTRTTAFTTITKPADGLVR